ncbi:MAG: hypothetical protein ACJ8GN_13340 [Longimicrobiaceae bacterium]
MKRLLAFSTVLLALAPSPGRAQATAARDQLSLGVGIVAGEIDYARRIGAGPLSVGAGVWGAWEPPHSFGHSVFEPLGIEVFGRYRAAPWLHVDAGPTLARYHSADDCPDCSGTFAGARTVLLVGQDFLFVGPELAAGWASDGPNDPEFGVIWGAQVRLVLGWGR